MNDEFYIGWMPDAPKGIAKHARRVVAFLMSVMVATGIFLATQQKKFSTAVFEFGQLTEIKGTFQQYPVPSLYVITGTDVFGKRAGITIPLVGYGKHGAGGVIDVIEKERKVSLKDKLISLKGTLLYSDGKTLLQIDQYDNPLVKVWDSLQAATVEHQVRELGVVDIKGEILDPKCYFGVMKPGHGKPHRDCATRCVDGGMSPVFSVQNERGATDYYLILGPRGEKINSQLKNWIADPVILHARAVRYDDWIVLYVDPARDIKRIAGASLFKEDAKTIYCGPAK